MTERSAVFQLIQIGVESTHGTQVAATKRLTSTQFVLGVKPVTKYYRGSGHLFDSVGSINSEMVDGTYSGGLTYTEIIYYLSSLFGAITPPSENMDTTTHTGSYTWAFEVALTSANDPVTFTIEQGEAASRYHNVTYALVTGMTITISRDGCEISGDVMSKALIDEGDGAVFTALTTSAELDLVPVNATEVSVYSATTQAGLDGASKLTRVNKVEWQFTGRWAPFFSLNGSSSFIAHLAQVPTMMMKVTMEADAEGMAYLQDLRTQDTVFFRVKAVGGNIYTGGTNYDYDFQLDMAGKISEPSAFADDNGLTSLDWTVHGVEDPTWGKAVEVKVTNKIATL